MSGKGAIEYISYADAVGYGTAAVGYVRLLVEAGLDVHWMPYPGDAIGSGRVGDGIGDAELSRGRAGLIARSVAGADSGLKPLIEATSRPVDARVRIIHLVPGYWLEHLSPVAGARHIGIGTWETDTIIRRWVPSLARMDHLCVPSAHNEAVLRAAPERLPAATVVPHLCRETLRPPPPARLAGLTKYLGIRPDDTVFYTINAWAPRKRLAQLIDGFVRSFTQEDNGRARRQDQPRNPVRRAGVSGQRPQRKPRRGGDHRPRRERARTAVAPHRRDRRRRTGRQFHRRTAYAWALFCFAVAVRGFRTWRV